MKSNWSNKWKKVLIWFSGYFSFVAFAIVGGYAVIKGNDEELKKTAKTAFIVTLIFACINAFLTIFSSFAGISDNYYISAAYDFYSIFSGLVSVAKIIVFAVFIIIELAKKEEIAADAKENEKIEEEKEEIAELVNDDDVIVEAEIVEDDKE